MLTRAFSRSDGDIRPLRRNFCVAEGDFETGPSGPPFARPLRPLSPRLLAWRPCLLAIVELRKRGYTYRAIGKAVGMDGSAVMRALRRLQAGGKGTRPRD